MCTKSKCSNHGVYHVTRHGRSITLIITLTFSLVHFGQTLKRSLHGLCWQWLCASLKVWCEYRNTVKVANNKCLHRQILLHFVNIISAI